MKHVFAQTFPSGEVRADVTSITLVNNTVKTQDVAVPADTLWELMSIKATNPDDVARDITFRIFKEVGKTNEVLLLTTGTVLAGARLQWPNTGTGSQGFTQRPGVGFVLGPGMIIEVNWAAGGASTGGTDADGLVIFYRRLNLT